MRLVPLFVIFIAACRPGVAEERAPQLRELCEAYCPQRIACVEDGFRGGDVDECVQLCVDDERFLEDGECGEAAFALLECLAATACADLPAAVRGVVGAGDSAPCYAENREQQDVCDFEPRY